MSINVEILKSEIVFYFKTYSKPLFTFFFAGFMFLVSSQVLRIFLLLFTVACIKAALPKNMMLMFLMYYCNTDIFYLQQFFYFNIFFLFL